MSLLVSFFCGRSVSASSVLHLAGASSVVAGQQGVICRRLGQHGPENREGSGGACPSNFWTGGALPLQLWTIDVVHFYFCLFLHVTLCPSQKVVGEIRGVFLFLGRGYLGPRETFPPPPPNFKIVLGPLAGWPRVSLLSPVPYRCSAQQTACSASPGPAVLICSPDPVSRICGPEMRVFWTPR